MLTRNERNQAIETLNTMKIDIMTLLESLNAKDEEISKIENCAEKCKGILKSTERRLRIESLAYDIISGKDIQLLTDIQNLTRDYFNEPVPVEARYND